MAENNQAILTKAIKKAIEGGWDGKDDIFELVDIEAKYMLEGVNAFDVIFSHDFAKALWGHQKIEWKKIIGHEADKITPRYDALKHVSPAWQYHLQNMVVSDDPIKYLGDNI